MQTLARQICVPAPKNSGTQTRASVCFPYPQFVTAPEVGQIGVDAQGKYRIMSVTFTGDAWECEVTPL